jgi:hypothetical protein
MEQKSRDVVFVVLVVVCLVMIFGGDDKTDCGPPQPVPQYPPIQRESISTVIQPGAEPDLIGPDGANITRWNERQEQLRQRGQALPRQYLEPGARP